MGATASALAFLAAGGQDGGTPLDDSGALVAAGFLLDLGAGPDGGPEGYTPLMLAAYEGNASMAKLLLESNQLPGDRWLLAAHEAYCTFSRNLGVDLPPEPSRGELFAARSIKEAPTFLGRKKLRSGVFPHDWLC